MMSLFFLVLEGKKSIWRPQPTKEEASPMRELRKLFVFAMFVFALVVAVPVAATTEAVLDNTTVTGDLRGDLDKLLDVEAAPTVAAPPSTPTEVVGVEDLLEMEPSPDGFMQSPTDPESPKTCPYPGGSGGNSCPDPPPPLVAPSPESWWNTAIAVFRFFVG
jgi:hypothetical protein